MAFDRSWFREIDDETLDRFVTYHRDNPEIWRLFLKYAAEAKRAGRERFSAKAVMERIRWECEIGGANGGKFKVNNNFTSFYVRAICGACPEFKGFFETRALGRVRSDQTSREDEVSEAA